MSGLLGWFDPDLDVRREGQTAMALMMDASSRGEGEAATWAGPELVLGLTGSALCGPAITERAGQAIVAVCDGYVVGADTTVKPPVPPGGVCAQSAAVLNAYLSGGLAAVTRLDGVFAFVLWDGRTRELLLGRDRLGIKPLSWTEVADGVVFASEVAALAAHPRLEAELDADGLCALLTQLRTPGHGVLRGVREVLPGTVVICSAGRRETRSYWSLRAAPHELDLPTTVGRVREILEDAVARDLRDIPPAVLLSGGLDSSVLTGLVARSPGGPAPRTFTVVFGKTAIAVPDRPYAQEVAEFWKCDHEEIVLRAEELTTPTARALSLAAKDYPTPFGDKNITPYLFSRRIAEGTPTVLSGEGADAMFGGLGGHIDESRVLTSFPWIERARKFGLPHGLGTGLFRQDVLGRLDVTGHTDRMFREALTEVPSLPGDTPVDRLARQVDYLTTTRLLEQTVLHSERLGAAAGLHVRFPFADHRLYAFLYNVPARMKSFDGREKSLLRAIADDLVPSSVLTRSKVPYPITYDKTYKAALVIRLRDLLDDRSAPVLPLLDRSRAAAYIEDPKLLDRGGWLGRADVEQVLQLDAWLRRLRVRMVGF
ncbi:asparagine synthetase B family protein (plasmid) [Streptomyces sp. AHU1]|uniref:asparagine synthetase B family protein n=1 Tax=Streptomyces sp. AHU1 TaxID=3377215 RepID=UPI0038782B03